MYLPLNLSLNLSNRPDLDSICRPDVESIFFLFEKHDKIIKMIKNTQHHIPGYLCDDFGASTTSFIQNISLFES